MPCKRWPQVLINLVSNSAKVTPTGGTIAISAELMTSAKLESRKSLGESIRVLGGRRACGRHLDYMGARSDEQSEARVTSWSNPHVHSKGGAKDAGSESPASSASLVISVQDMGPGLSSENLSRCVAIVEVGFLPRNVNMQEFR